MEHICEAAKIGTRTWLALVHARLNVGKITPEEAADEADRIFQQAIDESTSKQIVEKDAEIERLRKLCGEAAFRGRFAYEDEWLEEELRKAASLIDQE